MAQALAKWPHRLRSLPVAKCTPLSLILEFLTSLTLRCQELDVFLISGLSVFTQKNDELSKDQRKRNFLVLFFEMTPL